LVRELSIRQRIEEREESLSPHAARSRLSRGRDTPEAPCPIRTAFMRDRDRIIYCKAFRRLKHKTQVFIAPAGDHYVTRLTHTLEVSQIARTIARALNLNEDLTEAISLGHDLGHTPFGHVGEEVLNALYRGGFRHNEQSLRVVEVLENNGRGLNLTWEVRDGILNHSKTQADILGADWEKLGTLEAEVCRLADMVAYINHDIDDAVRAKIITEGDLPLAAVAVLGNSHAERINTMVCDIIEASWGVSEANSPFQAIKLSIGMTPPVLEATNTLRNFLFARVYNLRSAQGEVERARQVVRHLYRYYVQHAEQLPPEYSLFSDEIERRVVDYIACMTDHYAQRMAAELPSDRTKVSP
jgi:dGTPase